MKKSKLIAAVLFAVLTAVSLTGCGERADKVETETQKQTEAPTEPATEAITEAPTEAPTEKQTEAPTERLMEPETEAVTEEIADFPDDMTGEEEMEYETEFEEPEIYFAADDVNVRATPTTDEENVLGSFDQGEEVTVTGETPHWFVVELDELTGYVRKDLLSDAEVTPKTEEERANNVSEAENMELGVSAFAEHFTIQMSSDANLRKQPNEQGEIIGTVRADEILTATGETDEWYQVMIDETVAYVNKNLVQ